MEGRTSTILVCGDGPANPLGLLVSKPGGSDTPCLPPLLPRSPPARTPARWTVGGCNGLLRERVCGENAPSSARDRPRRLADLSASALERWFTARKADGMGAATRNEYRKAWATSCNWVRR